MFNKLGSKIIIIGNSGSGKTTLSYQLGELLKLPVIHLDKEYWKKDWEKTPKEEWRKKVNAFVSGLEWILDGNFNSTLEIRINKADTVIFLDYNRFVCLFGVIKRIFRYLGKTRPDMAEGCLEKFDFAFIKWVLWDFPSKSRKNIIKCLANYPHNEQIIIKNRTKLKKLLVASNNQIKEKA